jgi:hypothetical protein
MPFDPENPFAPADPSQWLPTRTPLRITVHPKRPPSAPPPDGIDDWYVPDGPDDWYVPGNPRTDASYPDDWYVPSAAPNMGQPAPGLQPNAANAGLSNPPAAPIANRPVAPPIPFANYWAMIPASRVGAMAWDPPNLPLFSPSPTNNFPAQTPRAAPPILPGSWPRTLGVDSPPWSSAPSLLSPAIPEGGLLGKLATLGTSPSPWPAGAGGTPPPATPTSSLAGGPFSGRPASPPMPSTLQAFFQGVGSATRQLGQTAQSVTGPPTLATEDSPAAEPLGLSDLASPSQIAPKIAYQFAQSYPTLAGGVAGGVVGGRVGALAGPYGAAAGTVLGGSLGAAALSATQTLGPVYAAELQKNPNDPEGAWNRAWMQAKISGAFSGASWAVFPARFFQGPVKQLVFQIFGAQPALAVAERATRNIVEGRPATEGLGEAYGQGVVGAAIPALGHDAVKSGLPARAPEGNRSPELAPVILEGKPADTTGAQPEARQASAPQSTGSAPTVEGGLTPMEQLSPKLAQLKINKAVGAAWEKTMDAGLDREKFDVAPQLTVGLPSGIRTKLDFVTRDRETGEIGRLECKASETAPVSPNQTRAFGEMEHTEATVLGKGKPGFPGGMKIPPGRVDIRRPRK